MNDPGQGSAAREVAIEPGTQSTAAAPERSGGPLHRLYHWVLGWKYFISRGMALAAELNGRYARISGYKGTEKRMQLYQQPERVPAELFFHEAVYETESGELRSGQLSPHPEVIWYSDGSYKYSNLKSRKATLDFSGVSLKLGVSYQF